MKGLIDEKSFTDKDWISAVSFLGELNRYAQAATLCQNALALYPRSSYLHYLFGQSLLKEGKKEGAKKELQKAVSLDPSNDEAVIELKQSFK